MHSDPLPLHIALQRLSRFRLILWIDFKTKIWEGREWEDEIAYFKETKGLYLLRIQNFKDSIV